jgi:voltage-gated potassium channel Kch
MSEFSLVIASLGLGFNHIDSQVVGILTFVFTITSVLSTYMIQYNHQIQSRIAPLLSAIGIKDIELRGSSSEEAEQPKEIVFLGFFREASSILYEIESIQNGGQRSLTDKMLVIDFNPIVHSELNRREIECIYGDISSVDTLKHAHVESAKVVVSSIPDSILRGTTNKRILGLVKRLCPEARVIVTANTLQSALNLYEEGADFVFIPRIHSARHVAQIVFEPLDEPLESYRQKEMANLRERREVLD